MRLKEEKANNIEELVFYPFIVNERDCEGRLEGCSRQAFMHGFGLALSSSMYSRFFDEDNTSVKVGAPVYEIRTRDNYAQWNDWQAIVGEVHILSMLNCGLEGLGEGDTTFFNDLEDKFRENFEIRKSGTLWKRDGVAQIIEDEDMDDVLLKEVDPDSLAVKYYCQADNPCYPPEEQIKDMVKFRNKYHAYDENGNRI